MNNIKTPSDFKDLFLKLTEYTIPYGHESKLEKYLPNGYEKDSIGNYFIQIGNSETLFTTHLDTYCKEYEKVNHVIDGNIIKTDGTTILGGDNKLGMSILLYMIDKNIPGTYYFFLGEEPILSGGLWGSRNALASHTEFFSKFKRAIAFDRKQMGSVVTRQKARFCCSNEFVDVLCKELSNLGIESIPDHKAYYTDTATFLDTIPECTNISAGGWNEHSKTEWVDIAYTYAVAQAACEVKWEELPTNREIKKYTPKYTVSPRYRFTNKKIIKKVKEILNKYDLLHTNVMEYDTFNSDTLVFNTWFEELNIRVTIIDDILVQIDGYDDVRFSLSDVFKLNIYLGSIFGVEIDPKDYKMMLYTDDSVSILGLRFKSFVEYLKYFTSINNEKTSYVIKKGGEQYTEYYGDIIPRDLVLKWFKDNIL